VIERTGIIGTHGNSFFKLLRGIVLIAEESIVVGEQHARTDVLWNNIDLMLERIDEFVAQSADTLGFPQRRQGIQVWDVHVIVVAADLDGTVRQLGCFLPPISGKQGASE